MINSVILRGYVADDPFVRATEGGKFVRVRLVTIEKLHSKKSGVVRSHTEWHTLLFWGDIAQIVDRDVRAGAPIYVEGALRTRNWTNRDGVDQKTTEIFVNKFELLDSIEGHSLPSFIEAAAHDKSRPEKDSKLEIKRPAEDPDDLPF